MADFEKIKKLCRRCGVDSYLGALVTDRARTPFRSTVTELETTLNHTFDCIGDSERSLDGAWEWCFVGGKFPHLPGRLNTQTRHRNRRFWMTKVQCRFAVSIRAQRAREAVQTGGRLALVERCGASGQARRRPRKGRASPRPLRRPLRLSRSQSGRSPSAEALSAAHGPPTHSGARWTPRRSLTASPPHEAAIRVRNGADRSRKLGGLSWAPKAQNNQ